jgi:purine catabolism regulator
VRWKPKRLVSGVRQARAAAAADNQNRIAHFDDLGVDRLLLALTDDQELSNFVENEIGSVLFHNARSANPLLPTLRAFLDCGGNKSRTTEMLFVQRRTLYHPLGRLDALLKCSLDDVEVQVRLQLAVRGHDLLHRRWSSVNYQHSA